VSNVADLALAAGLPSPGGMHPPLIVEPTVEDDDSVTISVAVATDIWFAWNHPWHRLDSAPIDNRVLARLNAPRLNGFLADVREACRALGGTWTWTSGSTSHDYRPVDHEGFVLLE